MVKTRHFTKEQHVTYGLVFKYFKKWLVSAFCKTVNTYGKTAKITSKLHKLIKELDYTRCEFDNIVCSEIQDVKEHPEKIYY